MADADVVNGDAGGVKPPPPPPGPTGAAGAAREEGEGAAVAGADASAAAENGYDDAIALNAELKTQIGLLGAAIEGGGGDAPAILKGCRKLTRRLGRLLEELKADNAELDASVSELVAALTESKKKVKAWKAKAKAEAAALAAATAEPAADAGGEAELTAAEARASELERQLTEAKRELDQTSHALKAATRRSTEGAATGRDADDAGIGGYATQSDRSAVPDLPKVVRAVQDQLKLEAEVATEKNPKVLMVGGSGVGKTSIRAMLQEWSSRRASEPYVVTPENAAGYGVVEVHTPDGETHTMRLMTPASQDDNASALLTSLYLGPEGFASVEGVVLVVNARELSQDDVGHTSAQRAPGGGGGPEGQSGGGLLHANVLISELFAQPTLPSGTPLLVLLNKCDNFGLHGGDHEIMSAQQVARQLDPSFTLFRGRQVSVHPSSAVDGSGLKESFAWLATQLSRKRPPAGELNVEIPGQLLRDADLTPQLEESTSLLVDALAAEIEAEARAQRKRRNKSSRRRSSIKAAAHAVMTAQALSPSARRRGGSSPRARQKRVSEPTIKEGSAEEDAADEHAGEGEADSPKAPASPEASVPSAGASPTKPSPEAADTAAGSPEPNGAEQLEKSRSPPPVEAEGDSPEPAAAVDETAPHESSAAPSAIDGSDATGGAGGPATPAGGEEAAKPAVEDPASATNGDSGHEGRPRSASSSSSSSAASGSSSSSSGSDSSSSSSSSSDSDSSAGAKIFKPPPPKKGFLRKKGHRIRSWKRRYFELIEGTMTYFTEQGGKRKGTFNLTEDCLVTGTSRKHQIKLEGQLMKPRVFVLEAPSDMDMEVWIKALEDHVDYVAACARNRR